jgi:hypothetical protein
MDKQKCITIKKYERYPSMLDETKCREIDCETIIQVKKGFLIDVLKELESLKRKLQPLLK